MKIELGYWEVGDACRAIRDRITCGKCASSTLLIWEGKQFGERPKGTSSATIVTDDEDSETETYYLVRCSFFKFNVTDPDFIVHCEGFVEK